MTPEAERYQALFLVRYPYRSCACWMCGEAPYTERHHAHGRGDGVVRIEDRGRVYEVVAHRLIAAVCGRCHRIMERNKSRYWKDGAAMLAIHRGAHELKEGER